MSLEPDPLASLQAELGPRYAVEELIGKGGMALVYRALDLQLQRPVAVKVLSPSFVPLLGEDRFLREIRLAARLQHPGIVPLYEAGGSGRMRYYTMPLVDGESLRARLDRVHQLPLDEVIHITMEVAEALRYAHSQGVVHRDIKPENIMLTGERVQVADFGIARAISLAGEDRLTSAGVAIGTPWYMSPEQASQDGDLDGRSDIYSLGCLCYEMLAGTPPFTGATPQVIVARHLSDSVPSLKVARNTAPAGLVAATNAMLAKAPADRPDADRVLRLLHLVQQHPEHEPGQRKVRPGTIAGILTGIAVAAVVYWLARPAPALNPNNVVVFPFTESGPEPTGAGEAVARLVGSALEHTEPLRWDKGWGVFETWTRESRAFSSREAARITQRLGARYYLDGSIVAYGEDSLSVTVRLHDIALDSIHQESVSGTARPEVVQAAATLAQRAIVPLLGVLTGPSRHVELTYLKDRKPGAIAMWLEGERQMRSANFRDALESYRRALEVDSTLAVAALTAAGVAIWTHQNPAADSLARLALRHSDGLPTRNLTYAEGMVDFLAGRGDRAVDRFAAAIAADSTWSPAWMMLGDSYHHLITGNVAQDSLAEAAFSRTLELDPGFAPALFHLAEDVLKRGDTGTGSQLIEKFRAVNHESELILQLEMMNDCQRRGPAAVQWSALAVQVPLRVLGVASDLGAAGRRLDCAEAAARAVFADSASGVSAIMRWGAFKWLHHLSVARDDLPAALALIDTATNSIFPAAQGLLIMDAVFAGTDPQLALPVLEFMSGPLDELAEVEWLWYRGIWATLERDTLQLDSIAQELGRRVPTQPTAAALATAFRARSTLLRGDSAQAIALLRSVRPTGGDIRFGLWESFAAERLLLSQLLLASGQHDEAGSIAASLDGAQSDVNLYFLPASLVVRLQAAEQLGRSATAELLRDRLRSLGRSELLDAGGVH